MSRVAERAPLGGGRRWFVDARSPARRMGVSSHPDARVAVISLWHGDTCTATFHMSLDHAPRLIAALAEGLAMMPERPPLRSVE